MAAERTSLITSSPRLLRPLRLSARKRQALPPAIVAPRSELCDEAVGTLSYFTNLTSRAEQRARRGPALLLIHAPCLGASAHDLQPLFECFRDERALFAPDLPGFGQSVPPAAELDAELCAMAIERVLDVAVGDAQGGVDIVAAGLSAEFAAKVSAHRPDAVRSLTLLQPTGFASEDERGSVEAAARRDKTLWSVSLLRRMGLASLLVDALSTRASLRYQRARRGLAWSPGALRQAQVAARQPEAADASVALLAGALYPRENPLAIYTRVHCPTLVITGHDRSAGYRELPRFVKWRDHFSTQHFSELSLADDRQLAELTEAMRAFWDGPGRRSRVC